MGKSDIEILETAKQTIRTEVVCIENLLNYVDGEFVKVVKLLFDCKGRVVVSGIGKSALIGNKIVLKQS